MKANVVKTVLCVSLVLFLGACGKESTEGGAAQSASSRPIYGTWGMDEPLKMGAGQLKLLVEFQPGRIINKSTCVFEDGVEVTGEVASEAEYTDTTIRVTQPAVKKVNNGERDCTLNIFTGIANYRIEKVDGVDVLELYNDKERGFLKRR